MYSDKNHSDMNSYSIGQYDFKRYGTNTFSKEEVKTHYGIRTQRTLYIKSISSLNPSRLGPRNLNLFVYLDTKEPALPPKRLGGLN